MRLAFLIPLVVAATPARASEVFTIPVGDMLGEIAVAAAVAFGSLLAGFIVRLLAKLGAKTGIEVDEARRARLAMVAQNAITFAATALGHTLNGKLTAETKNEVLAKAAEYFATHAADTIKALKGDPNDTEAMKQIVAGWAGERLTTNEVPV